MTSAGDRRSAFSAVEATVDDTRRSINRFCARVFRTRGGKIGSGMGSVLEALWGYYSNDRLHRASQSEIELAWFPEHQYHDFACVKPNIEWNPATKRGELFRIEAKSMNEDADESKAHFDVLTDELDPFDTLVLLVWRWKSVDRWRVSPFVIDIFFGPAKPVARLRDELHKARGGSFVDRNSCPDACPPSQCAHHGEPLNRSGTRERTTGPTTQKGPNTSFAANFGGMLRMLKTNSNDARTALRAERQRCDVAHRYISFIHKHCPDEERNHYRAPEWRRLASILQLRTNGTPEQLQRNVRRSPDYPEALRTFS